MSDHKTPLLPPSQGLGDRLTRWGISAAVRASLLFSPRPAAWLVNRAFASGDAAFAAQFEKYVPAGIEALVDERYGDEPDTLLDVVRPAAASGALPLLLWVHGGGFIGGSKDGLRGYLKILASDGYVVAGANYSLAPNRHYPTPPRQMMQALEYLQSNAERLRIDPERIAIAGDSAGAHITGQIGALVTTPGYADAVGVAPTITPAQLRGLALACGPFDLGLARQASSPAGRRFIQVVLWSYSGRRDYLEDRAFATWSVTDNVTPAFPPSFISVGNADPLRPHSELLAEKLRAQGVETETLFFPADQEPALGHEYQFVLDTEPGQRFLERLRTFLRQRLGAAA
jgi:acetyl esterase